MIGAGLSLQQTPPFSVTARFLITAPMFGVLAGLVLLWAGPDALSHRWTAELLAVTHLFTLGFLAMSMLGAMMQLMPVLIGVVMPRPVLFSTVVHTPLLAGSVCLALAWLLHSTLLFSVALGLLAVAFAVFILFTLYGLLRSSNKQVTRTMMLLAIASLLVTVGLGMVLAIGHGFADVAIARHLTGLHLSWGLAGWVLLLIMAVAYQVIPMFQITDEYPALHQRWLGWFIVIALLVYSFAHGWPLTTVKTAMTLLLALCALVFALTSLWVLHKRRRRVADLTLNFWRLAMSSLALAGLGWLVAVMFSIDIPVLVFGVLVIVGFAMTSVNGMMYKIIPFLIWLHLSARNKALRDRGHRNLQVQVPHMRAIISATAGLWQFRVHVLSVILLVLAGVMTRVFFYPAALALIIAQGLLLFNLAGAARFYYAKDAEFRAVVSSPV